jgi:hypothetical protein
MQIVARSGERGGEDHAERHHRGVHADEGGGRSAAIEDHGQQRIAQSLHRGKERRDGPDRGDGTPRDTRAPQLYRFLVRIHER